MSEYACHAPYTKERRQGVRCAKSSRKAWTSSFDLWRRNYDGRESTNRGLFCVLVIAFCICGLASLGSAAHVTARRTKDDVKNERPLLLYIPMHVSEPIEHLQELCDSTLSKDPWIDHGKNNREEIDSRDSKNIAFDIVLVVSGPSEASRNATARFDRMRSMLENATETIFPSPPRIFLDYKIVVGVDRYNLNLDNEDKDAEWVSGPNSVFYDAFTKGGEIYDKYVRYYALVQQLETDVVALRGGWLSALVEPMLKDDNNNLIIMSGSTIKSSCMYVVKFDECQPFEEGARHMIEHINGNAVYRIGPLLQQVMKASREQFKNSEPFDLAMHHVLKASNWMDLVHSNPLYHNTATLLDRDWFTDVRYHGVDDLAVLHAPRRLRADGLKAVATRAQSYLPATTMVLSKESIVGLTRIGGDPSLPSSSSPSSSTLLRNFKAAADAVRLSGVIYIATSEDVFFEASRVVPLQVLPAFEQKQRRRDSDGGVPDDDDEKKAEAAAAEAAATASAATVDPKSLILTWPPTSTSPSMRLFSTITQLVTQGYSPLVVDPSSVPLQNYDMVLYGFPKDAIYFVDTKPIVEDGSRRPFDEFTEQGSGTTTITIETMFVPASAYTANLLQAWAVTMFQREVQKQQQQQQQQQQQKNAPPAHLTLAEVKALAACHLETAASALTLCPWRGVGVETLPIHWFPPQVAFFGTSWTKRARKHAFFLDMSSGRGGGGGGVGGGISTSSTRSSTATKDVESTSTTIFRLRHAGKWHSPVCCPSYSVLSRLPRDLTHETVLDEMAIHADFLSFVRQKKIACAVLPGFRIPSTSTTLPVDALFDLETIRLSAGAQVTILPRVQDVEDASVGHAAFDVRRRETKRTKAEKVEAASKPRHSREQSSLATTMPSPRVDDDDDLCSRFYNGDRPTSPSASSSTFSCLAKDISDALEEARSRLSSTESYACALDSQRSVEEVALAGLQGPRGLAEVASEVLRNVRESKLPPKTILLTGAWRLLPRGSFRSSISGNVEKASPNLFTLADLHSHDQRLQSALDLNPKMSVLVDEAWTGIVETLLCFFASSDDSAIAALDLSRQHRVPPPSKRATTARRKRKTSNYAELVARHIPPSILLEDVTAFTKWLARPDRPKLVSGRSLQLYTDHHHHHHHHENRHKAALDALEVIAPAVAETKADLAFLPTASDATTGALLPWSSVTDIGKLYRARPTVLPPSLAVMMHPAAVLEFLNSPESSTLPLVVEAKGSTSKSSGADVDKDVISFEEVIRGSAFRTTVAALAKRHRLASSTSRQREKKKLWLLPSVGSRSRDTSSVSSIGTGDDVVVRKSEKKQA